MEKTVVSLRGLITMEFRKFKPYVKYGLFLIFVLSLVDTAYADSNQLVYYNWCQDTGNTIVDNSEYGNNGMNHGSTTFVLPTGQTARHFDGQSRVTIPDDEQLTTTDPHITIGVFFRYDCSNPANYTYLVSKGNNTCRIGIDHTSSTIVYEIYADGGHTISGHSDCKIEPDEDYEAIVTYDGSHAQLYINGITSGEGVDYTATALGSSYGTNSWTIGSTPDAAYGLNGAIYAFYVYDRTLNSSEVLDLYMNDIHSIRALNRPGGIALSWDDTGHIDTCYSFLSIFQQYNATCTVNVNKISNRENTQTLVSELNALHSAGWEIAAHGYNHTDSAIFLLNHTPTEWLDQEIFPNIVEITRYGYPVYSLAYPFSNRTTTNDAILAPYFHTLRTGVPEVINKNVSQTPKAYYDWDNDPFLYGVEIDESRNISLESIEHGIDYAIATGNVLVLYGHAITPNVDGSYQTSTSRLDSILNYTVQNGGVFYHMGDLGNLSWVRPARFSNVTAEFTVSADTILAGESITFEDHSVNQTTELLDFGDSSPVSSTANVTHIYAAPGTYMANLTVANDVFSQFINQTITVILPSPPVANFTSNVTTGFPPLNVAFTDKSTGLPIAWSWDFGDGNTSTSKNPKHTYFAVGNYSVRLNITNENGANSTQRVNYIIVSPRPPSSNFTLDITCGNTPLTVKFSDTSTGYPTSWNWNFGDGGTSKDKNPEHTYFAAGNYTVTLKVSNLNGTDTKTAIGIITVLQSPVADFSISVTGGYAPLSVTFTDLSQNETSRSWDVNGDGIEDSNASSFTYEYASAGTYTAKLTAINENGTATKSITINVDEESSGGSGGGSGGGGAGGSPEPAKNVEVKELSQVFITNGNHVKFDFPKDVTDVVYLSFDSKKTAGKTTTIVEMLKNKSTLTPDTLQGEVYSYLNIWVGNGGYATEKNIENATVCFRVKKSWIEDEDIDQSSIVLNRYSDKSWNELPTTLLKEDDRYLYFTAKTPGFSPFAITAKKIVIEMMLDTEDSEQNGSVKSNIEKDTEQTVNNSNPQKDNLRTPGFEMIYCILGLFGVFLHKRQ